MDRKSSSVHEVFANFEVALRKESVDRKQAEAGKGQSSRTSLSARRAWIEKGRALRQLQFALVALRKESVDRKRRALGFVDPDKGRSPQGERG